jgi:hypothetical protein
VSEVRAEEAYSVHIAVTDITLRLALTYLSESDGCRVTVHRDAADVVVGDLRAARIAAAPVDVVVVDPLPLPCQEGIDLTITGRARAVVGSDDPRTLTVAMRSAANGLATIPCRIIDIAGELPRLPDRLDATLRCVIAGQTTSGIAHRLHQSESTIKRDISALLRHFDAPNRQSLAGAAAAAGYRS